MLDQIHDLVRLASALLARSGQMLTRVQTIAVQAQESGRQFTRSVALANESGTFNALPGLVSVGRKVAHLTIGATLEIRALIGGPDFNRMQLPLSHTGTVTGPTIANLAAHIETLARQAAHAAQTSADVDQELAVADRGLQTMLSMAHDNIAVATAAALAAEHMARAAMDFVREHGN